MNVCPEMAGISIIKIKYTNKYVRYKSVKNSNRTIGN